MQFSGLNEIQSQLTAYTGQSAPVRIRGLLCMCWLTAVRVSCTHYAQIDNFEHYIRY